MARSGVDKTTGDLLAGEALGGVGRVNAGLGFAILRTFGAMWPARGVPLATGTGIRDKPRVGRLRESVELL